MFKRKKYEKSLSQKIYKLNRNIEKNNIFELAELFGNTKKLLVKNFLSGLVKGFGISIGFSLLSALLIFVLQKIIRLNIPIISEYITDIIDIVEKNR